MGHTAPDVQNITGQDRTVTHFFDLPILPGMQLPWRRLLADVPQLAPPDRLPPELAVFIAGYRCHLQADWFWVKQIFFPVFGPLSQWDTFPRRLYLHNVLRAYLDQQILPNLSPDMGSELDRVQPDGWLPFVPAGGLDRWRDILARQLHPGAASETVEVFASRHGLSPDMFYQMLASEERLDQEIFRRLPRQVLAEYRSQILSDHVRLVLDSLRPGAASPRDPS